MRQYGKAIIAVLTTAAVYAYQSLSGDGRIDATEWVSVAIAAVAAVGVYLVPLAPRAKWTKTAVAVALAVLQVLTTVVLGGLDADEVLLLIITAAGTAGIYLAPAQTAPAHRAPVTVGAGADR